MSGVCIQTIINTIIPLEPTHVHLSAVTAAVANLANEHTITRVSLETRIAELEEELEKKTWLLENAKNRSRSHKKRPRVDKRGYIKNPEKYDDMELHDVLAEAHGLSDDELYELAQEMNKV